MITHLPMALWVWIAQLDPVVEQSLLLARREIDPRVMRGHGNCMVEVSQFARFHLACTNSGREFYQSRLGSRQA
jgi:hypothetical protein